MATVTKTTKIANGAEIKVEFWCAVVDDTINADGHTINTDGRYQENIKVALTVGGKTQYGLRVLDANNKFDAPVMAKGAVAKVGTQPIGKATYDAIISLINSARAECMTPDLAEAKAQTTAKNKAAAEELKVELEADAAYERRQAEIYKMMDADENRGGA